MKSFFFFNNFYFILYSVHAGYVKSKVDNPLCQTYNETLHF